MEYKTTNEMSKIWGISERRIARLCAEDRIHGVKKIGKVWAIPENTEKPNDARIHSGKYCKNDGSVPNVPQQKPLAEFVNRVFEADCLDIMPGIPDASIDMILCDLPYGVTQNAWDSYIGYVLY